MNHAVTKIVATPTNNTIYWIAWESYNNTKEITYCTNRCLGDGSRYL